MMQVKFRFGFGEAVAKKRLQIRAFDKPWHLTAISNQTVVFDPTDDCLPVPAERLRGLPDGVNVMCFDPVRGAHFTDFLYRS